jgi:hypothetical protein
LINRKFHKKKKVDSQLEGFDEKKCPLLLSLNFDHNWKSEIAEETKSAKAALILVTFL